MTNTNPQHEKILRIKEGSKETIEGSDELRKGMNATFKDHPDAFVDEVVRLAEDKALVKSIQEAPERKVFYIKTKNMSYDERQAYIDKVKNELDAAKGEK